MATISFEGRALEVRPQETVLECLERHGIELASGCRAGACQRCRLRVRAGDVPPSARTGLRASLQARGYLMSCVCPARDGLVLERGEPLASCPARIAAVEPFAPGVMRVRLALEGSFPFEPGQFVQVVRPDGLMRPYSIASLPGDPLLELHVALRTQGRMSRWLAASAGGRVELQGPAGDCCYVPGELERPLLLAGTGTGLAPLYGVLRAALRAEHRGSIYLYHGSRACSGLYLFEQLSELARIYDNLTVVGSALSQDVHRPGVRLGRIEALVRADHPRMAGYRVFLCGHPELVRLLRKQAYLAGAALADIHSDPFVPSVSDGPKAEGTS